MLAKCVWDVKKWAWVLRFTGILVPAVFTQVKGTDCLHTHPTPDRQEWVKREGERVWGLRGRKPVRLNWEIKLIYLVWIIFIFTMVIESDLYLFYLHSQQVLADFQNYRRSRVELKFIFTSFNNIFLSLLVLGKFSKPTCGLLLGKIL